MLYVDEQLVSLKVVFLSYFFFLFFKVYTENGQLTRESLRGHKWIVSTHGVTSCTVKC